MRRATRRIRSCWRGVLFGANARASRTARGQIVNEFEEILAVERQRAAKRRQAAQNNDTADEIAEVETFPEQGGEARDKAAEKVNAEVSGRTLEKGKKVKDKAESDDEPEEVLDIETTRAEERKKEATGHTQKFADAETGESREKAAEKIEADVSHETLRKGKTVKDKAEANDEPRKKAPHVRIIAKQK